MTFDFNGGEPTPESYWKFTLEPDPVMLEQPEIAASRGNCRPCSSRRLKRRLLSDVPLGVFLERGHRQQHRCPPRQVFTVPASSVDNLHHRISTSHRSTSRALPGPSRRRSAPAHHEETLGMEDAAPPLIPEVLKPP